jgi:anti-repressor protein
MTTDIEQFQFPVTGQAVRTAIVSGETMFFAADVCAVLGHTEASKIVKGRLDPDEYVTVDVPRDTVADSDISTTNRALNPMRLVVSESGLFSLILWSHKPEAKAFRKWVTAEVLPAIRRTGSYSVAVPQSLPDALRAYADEVESHQRTLAVLAEAEPKADAWDALASAKGDYSVREAAHILNRDPAIETGQNRLFQKLRDLKLIDKNDIPYAAHSRHVVLRTRSWRDPDGVEQSDGQVRITADGLRYLRKRLGTSPVLAGLEVAA